jgi:ribosomal protein L11 methyltransferase
VPYRIEAPDLDGHALDRLVALGAIDIDLLSGGVVAALMPDGVSPAQVASALGVNGVSVSPAAGRDGDSVWVLGPRETRVGRLRIVPAGGDPDAAAVRLIDGPAFGTGLHPTTALCLQAIQDAVEVIRPDIVLDVGTGSGVLALAALTLGVPRAVGVDIDEDAVLVAARNARVNGMGQRLLLVRGGPEAVAGMWPLVLANVQAAPLIEMASTLVRRLGHRGRLVLSGIGASVEQDVARAYTRLGLRRLRVMSRDGWVALVLEASW